MGGPTWNDKLTKDRFGEKHEALAIVASGAPNYIGGKVLGVQIWKKLLERHWLKLPSSSLKCGI